MGFFSKLKRIAEVAVKIFRDEEPDELIRPVQEETTSTRISKEQEDRLERLREQGRDVIREANLRYDELIREDVSSYSPAFLEATEKGGYFDVEDLDSEVDIIREIQRASSFIQDESSNLDVATYLKRKAMGEEIAEETRAKYDLDIYTTRVHEDNAVKSYWEIMDRVRELESIKPRLAGLSYSKDAAYSMAFARWEDVKYLDEDEQIKELEKAMKEFLDNAEKVQSYTLSTPQSGVASFKREGDSFRRKGDW